MRIHNKLHNTIQEEVLQINSELSQKNHSPFEQIDLCKLVFLLFSPYVLFQSLIVYAH